METKTNYSKSKLILLALFFILLGKLSIAQTSKEDKLIGDWMDASKETLVRCYKVGDKYYAKLLWVENKEDIGKPLPKEEQHWINMVVMKDFKYDLDNNEWINGTIYQPKTDNTYTAFLNLKSDNVLQVTGYVLLRMFNEKAIFTRVINNSLTLNK